MAKVPTVKARDEFSDVINRAAYGKERVVLTRRGKELAAVVPIEDVKFLQDLEDRIDLESARDALKEPGTIAWRQLKKELGL
jgi:prevent-host-death family protein